MNILMVINRPYARNLNVIVHLSRETHQKHLKCLMDKRMFREAFDFVYSNATPRKYLDPQRENLIKAPDYILVEDLIIDHENDEKLSAA